MSYFLRVNPADISPSEVKTIRLVSIVAGIVAVIFGIAILFWPQATLTAVAWLFGVYFVVSGASRIIRAIMAKGLAGSYRAFLAVLGVLLIIGGVVVLINPLFGVTVLATIIGITWILEGIGVLMDLPRGKGAWVGVAFGLISIAAGVVVLFAPVAATVFWLQVTAILLILAGIMQTIQGTTLGRSPRS
ncbi:HdeD family acid-resistance protein [Mycetocola zhadangensis]|uniref:HdeD family acid-resistance protein n=1 Tax=Mycetocola zhadangensis TaxID=1164595 RepID=UPI00160355CE|nr:DUF308 domain-containing protein [Mycetocola zhadangensis]